MAANDPIPEGQVQALALAVSNGLNSAAKNITKKRYMKHLEENNLTTTKLAKDRFGRPVITDGAEAKTVKVGRNDPCPCGSKKKFKHCHLQNLAVLKQ